MIVLGIESSCDETGVALVKTEDAAPGRSLALPTLLAHALHSQIEMHQAYGGVVPELASRDHIRRVVPLVREVMQHSANGLADVDVVAGADVLERDVGDRPGDRARAGSLAAADMEGGVFTITNLGGFGIDEFTPIINLPQAAILGVGSIRREPVVVTDTDGAERIAVRDRMALSLTFDHCRVDGAPAARFLDDLRAAIEAPDGIEG